MKRIIFLLLSISINFSLIAQDRIDPDSYLDYLAAPDSIFNFNPNKFIKGWNWNYKYNFHLQYRNILF